MRILIITAHFRPNMGGVETHLTDLVLALAKRKNSVFVLTYKPLTANVKAKIFEKDKNLEVLRIPWIAGYFYKFVKKPILEFIYLVPGLFLLTPFIIFSKKPDVIHSHGLIAGFAGVFWGKIFGIRNIATTHSIYHFPEKGIYHNFSRWLFSNSDIVLTLSRQSKKEIEDLGVKKDKIKVFTYWIDLFKFKVSNSKLLVRKSLGWQDRFVVLYAGRLVVEKGVLVLLEAAKIWNKKITLTIAGTGPLEKKVKETMMISGNIMYLGMLSQDELSKIYSASNLLIIPSIHEEGFGRVILEALACGLPVIGSKRGAIPEAMDDTVGKLIEVTPKNIKNAVEYFYKNPDKLNSLSKNARRFAEKRYSEKNVENITNALSS